MNVYIYDNLYEKTYSEEHNFVQILSSSTTIDSFNLTKTQAVNRVLEIYNNSKTQCLSSVEKLIDFDKGYAEYSMFIEDNRVISRVIYIK